MIVGTRGSKLALTQTKWVICELKKKIDIEVEIRVVKTAGDKIKNSPLHKVSGFGFFVREIDSLVLKEEIDFAVHSLKDVPLDSLFLAAIPKRESPYDCLVSEKEFWELPVGARIGTSSLRRKSELLRMRKDLEIVDLRGNLDTRLGKLENLDGIVIAKAGLNRLGIKNEFFTFKPSEVMPPAGQGALAVVCRKDDFKTRKILKLIDDKKTRIEIEAEREFLRGVGGGCQVPVGVVARFEEELRIEAMINSKNGKKSVRGKISGFPKKSVGKKLAEKLLRGGGKAILEG
ncbi:MAG: hydroxymethylbilane synthase [Candidatus Methanofastidiosia archaeon]